MTSPFQVRRSSFQVSLSCDVAFQAVEILVDDEVDHAGDGVRTPGGRGAAGHHVDALDQGWTEWWKDRRRR